MLTSYARSLTGWAMRARSSRGHISSRSERLKHDGSRSEGRRNEWNDCCVFTSSLSTNN